MIDTTIKKKTKEKECKQLVFPVRFILLHLLLYHSSYIYTQNAIEKRMGISAIPALVRLFD